MHTHDTTIRVYNQIIRHYARCERVPTIRELTLTCNIASTSVTAYHVNKLHDWGWIVGERGLGSGRAYRLNRITERWLTALELRELIG